MGYQKELMLTRDLHVASDELQSLVHVTFRLCLILLDQNWADHLVHRIIRCQLLELLSWRVDQETFVSWLTTLTTCKCAHLLHEIVL